MLWINSIKAGLMWGPANSLELTSAPQKRKFPGQIIRSQEERKPRDYRPRNFKERKWASGWILSTFQARPLLYPSWKKDWEIFGVGEVSTAWPTFKLKLVGAESTWCTKQFVKLKPLSCCGVAQLRLMGDGFQRVFYLSSQGSNFLKGNATT